jgi:signal transduction histidine kinase
MAASLSLRARLGLSAALIVALVVGAMTLVANRIAVRAVETEAREAAAATAKGIAGELGERSDFPTEADLDAALFDFTRADPALRSLTVTRAGGDDAKSTLSTDETPAPEALAQARRAFALKRLVESDVDASSLHYVAVPLEHEHQAFGTLVAAVSLEPAYKVQRQIEIGALACASAGIVGLVLALEHLSRRLVFRPLGAIRGVMVRAAGGDLEARTAFRSDDEIGSVGQGLDAMLDRLADFNAALQGEVDHATGNLKEANRRLASTAERLFAARRDLARSEQLAAAGRMAADVAHQVGTPLNLVSGYVQMLLAEQEPGSRLAEKLATVRQQIHKVTTIVQGLLDRARRPVLSRGPVPVRALLEEVAELARPTLLASRVELTLDAPDGLPAIFADAGQIEQALLNLVTNSRDAMPEGGPLRLRARHVGSFIEIAVADSGQGIPPEVVSQVFDPLFTTKPPGKGSGLGLTIVREVVGAHGGSVDIASGPGTGSTVTVLLPVVTPGRRDA